MRHQIYAKIILYVYEEGINCTQVKFLNNMNWLIQLGSEEQHRPFFVDFDFHLLMWSRKIRLSDKIWVIREWFRYPDSNAVRIGSDCRLDRPGYRSSFLYLMVWFLSTIYWFITSKSKALILYVREKGSSVHALEWSILCFRL